MIIQCSYRTSGQAMSKLRHGLKKPAVCYFNGGSSSSEPMQMLNESTSNQQVVPILTWNPQLRRFEDKKGRLEIPATEHIKKVNMNILFKTLADEKLDEKVKLFDTSVRLNEGDRALELLKNIAEISGEDKSNVVDCGALWISSKRDLKDQVDVLDKVYRILGDGSTRDISRIFAYVLCTACNIDNDKLRNNSIVELVKLWKEKYSRNESLRIVFRHGDVLLKDNQKMVLNIINEEEGARSTENMVEIPEVKGSYSSIWDVFEKEIPNIEIVCDKSKIDRAKDDDGVLDYMKLYDLLSDNEKISFERVYEKVNQERQRSLETINLYSEEINKIENDVKRLDSLHSSKLVWRWNDAAKEYFSDLLKGKKTLYEEDKTVTESIEQSLSLLKVLKPSILASILSKEMFHFIVKVNNKEDDHSYYVSHLCLKLGKLVESEFSKVIMFDYYRKNNIQGGGRLITNGYVSKYWLYSDFKKWTPYNVVSIGSIMLSIALKLFSVSTPNRYNPGVTELKPAFWRSIKTEKAHTIGIIKINKAVLTSITKDEKNMASASIVTSSLPLLVTPRPFTAVNKGGYLYQSNRLINFENQANEQEAYLKSAIVNHKMDSFLDGLDDVSSCAWGINKKLLKVIDEIWLTGEPFLDIPPIVKEEIEYQSGKLNYYEKQLVAKKRVELMNKQCQRNGLANALEVARIMAKHGDRFYYTYLVDFRGRLYPKSSSIFTHLGQDSIRSLLQFWYAKPLGKNGLKWIKIHLANMYGVDKISNTEREEFINDNMQNVIDSAENPLTGGRWWTKGDNPFQSLAACMEISSAIKMSNPEEYLSRIAVNQDGSCNGLQHYAALGGDVNGAAQVNMISHAKKPSDVYSEVANIVCEKVDKDAGDGNQIAIDLQGKISRKLVKQPVMTSVYGVTRYGIVRQLDDKLSDIKDLDQNKLAIYGSYLSELILQAISELFSGANKIKEWFRCCSLRICESVRADNYQNISDEEFMNKYLTAIIWTTPLGLPVVQPYRSSQQMVVRTQLQSINLYNPFSLSFIDKPRQLQGIAPNYIHSLDSTHMLLTATECIRNGLSFAAVHDSYWTHASTVSDMSRYLREQFIKLHEVDLIEALRTEFITRSNGYMQLVHVPESFKSYEQIVDLRRNRGKEIDNLRRELDIEFRKFTGIEVAIRTPLTILKENNELGAYSRIGGNGGIFRLHKDKEEVVNTNTEKTIRVFIPVQIPSTPPKGNYDVKEVLNNDYFFS